MPTTYFISDLHLSEEYPAALGAFQRFLAEIACPGSQLYILGDFFDVWVGFEESSALHQAVASSLKKANEKGLKTFFMPGNRDFLISKDNCKQLFLEAIPDPYLFQAGEQCFLLLHGDSLCSDDKNYLRYRRFARNPLVTRVFSLLPMSFRQWVGKKMRGASNQNNQNKDAYIMDVTTDAVMSAFNTSSADIMIHGHTHKPGKHRYGNKDSLRTRLVLGAWHNEARILKLDESGLRFETLKIATN